MFYVALDTLQTREIRTVINFETECIPELLKAEGKNLNDEQIKKQLLDHHYNFLSKIFIHQSSKTIDLKIIIDLNTTDLIINSIKHPASWLMKLKLSNFNKIPECEYKKYFNSLELAQLDGLNVDHFENTNVNFYRHRFVISNRREHNDLKKFFTYSKRNWDINVCNIDLHDQISIKTSSRANQMSVSFRHDRANLKGALIKESKNNRLCSLFECT